MDLDEEGKIYGIEIVGVSERMSIESLGKINIDVPVAGVPGINILILILIVSIVVVTNP